jgi:hypothetical protein
MPRPTHIPTATSRATAKSLVGKGMPLATIAQVMNIAPKTLSKHYQAELDSGADIANAQVASKLFSQCLADMRHAAHNRAHLLAQISGKVAGI